MARPDKKGLDYFPFDVDFFEDEKIEAISGEFGIKGEIATIRLLCAVYRNGYFILWNEMLKMKLLKRLPSVSAELLEQIINRLVKWGFFDENLFNSVKILTSKGIQSRYFQATKRRKSNEKLPYLLVNVYNNNSGSELLHTKTTQRKEKNNNPPIIPQDASVIDFINFPDIKEKLLSDDEWKANACMQSGMSIAFMAIISDQIDDFLSYIKSVGEEESIATLNDAKRRFIYWWKNHGKKNYEQKRVESGTGGTVSW